MGKVVGNEMDAGGSEGKEFEKCKEQLHVNECTQDNYLYLQKEVMRYGKILVGAHRG